MFTVKAVGTFEGYEESKSHLGKYNVYIKPVAAAPAGVLRDLKFGKKYGEPVVAPQQMGTFCALCDESQLPQVGYGQLVTLPAVCWMICGQTWSKTKSVPVPMRSAHTLFVLDGEIKPTQAKPSPISIEFSGYLRGIVRSKNRPGMLKIRISPETMIPEMFLREVMVDRPGNGRGAVKAREIAGDAIVYAEPSMVQALPINALVTGTVNYWPVCEPYYKQETQVVDYRIIPDPLFMLSGALNREKVKASA